MSRRAKQVIRVLIADDHKVIRQGLASLLSDQVDITIVGEACDGPSAVEMAGRLSPDVILMDINLPLLNGMESTRRILAQRPQARIIGFSAFHEEEWSQAMLEAGAVVCLDKGGSTDKLIKSIRAVGR